jgi:hypothetical protein
MIYLNSATLANLKSIVTLLKRPTLESAPCRGEELLSQSASWFFHHWNSSDLRTSATPKFSCSISGLKIRDQLERMNQDLIYTFRLSNPLNSNKNRGQDLEDGILEALLNLCVIFSLNVRWSLANGSANLFMVKGRISKSKGTGLLK